MDISLYTPYPKQRKIHKSNAQFRVISGGRQSGKTLSIENDIMGYAAQNPGITVRWLGLSWRNVKKSFRHFLLWWPDAIKYKNEQDKIIIWKNDVLFEFGSADKPKYLRGGGANIVVLDEAAHMREDVWYEVLYPVLMTTGGKVIFLSTPSGRNWFWKLYELGKSPDHPDYESFHLSCYDNPYADKDIITKAKKELPEDIFRQEWLGEFLESTLCPFKNVDFLINDNFPRDFPNHNVIGVDTAMQQDYFVLTVFNYEMGQVMEIDRERGLNWPQQRVRIAAAAEKYNAPITIDVTSKQDTIIPELQEMGIFADGFIFSHQSKKSLLQNLQNQMEGGNVRFPSFDPLISELKGGQYATTSSGLQTYKFLTPHDDCVMSLALALWAAKDMMVLTPYSIKAQYDIESSNQWWDIPSHSATSMQDATEDYWKDDSISYDFIE